MSPHTIHPEAVRNVKLLLMDVDGVLTDGRLFIDAEGRVTKAFHARDGFGITLLHRAGIETGVVSGRNDPATKHRIEELGMTVVGLGEKSKGNAVDAFVSKRGLSPSEVAYIGDDVNDVPALTRVGISIAVANAHPEVLECVRYVTSSPGGHGAVREVADAILGVGREEDA